MQPADQRHFRPTDPREVIRFEEAADLTIEARLARVEAKLAISNVLATYAAAVQCGDTEATWDCFSEDVEYTLDGSVTMHATGKAAVLEHFRTHRGFIRVADGKMVWRGNETNFRHLMYEPVIKVSDDLQTAWVTSMFSGVITKFTAVHSEKHAHEGTYVLTFRNEGDRWRICKFYSYTELAYNPLYVVIDEEQHPITPVNRRS